MRGGEGRAAPPCLCGRTGEGWPHRSSAMFKRNRLGGKLSKSRPAVVKTNVTEYIHTHSTPPSAGAAQALAQARINILGVHVAGR